MTGLPPSFKLPLLNQEVVEGNCVVLLCELNKPTSSVEWRRAGELLRNGDKYQMRKKELQLEMKIAGVSLDDAGDYTCVCGEQRTTARIVVNGEYREDSSLEIPILCSSGSSNPDIKIQRVCYSFFHPMFDPIPSDDL